MPFVRVLIKESDSIGRKQICLWTQHLTTASHLFFFSPLGRGGEWVGGVIMRAYKWGEAG